MFVCDFLNRRSDQVLAVLIAGLMLSLSGGKTLAGPQVSSVADRATLIILAPLGPVLADLGVSVAKLPYRTWIGRYLARELDGDQNGRLTAAELQLMPSRLVSAAGLTSGADLLNAGDGQPAESDISGSDFAGRFSARLPQSFDLIAQPLTADDAVRLSTLIDADDNSIITADELQQAMRTLRFRDLDNDETWSVSELVPYRDPRSQMVPVTPEVENLPFFYVLDDEDVQRAARRIIARYGSEGTIRRELLRLGNSGPGSGSESPVAILDQSALESLIRAPQYHLAIDVRLSDNANVSAVDVRMNPAVDSFCAVRDEGRGQVTLVFDGLPLTILARGGGKNNRAAVRGFLGQSFVMADGDRNQYLDTTEFNAMVTALATSGVPSDFTAADHNSDGMITRDELFSLAAREQAATASRIEMTVRQDGKTLFSLLDRNADRRLSVREFHSGQEILRQFDQDGDGRFAETELGTEYILTLGLGQSELRRQAASSGSMMMEMNSGDAILSGRESLSGPEWFKRMDRNQDGDVSRREFTGTFTQFQQLDHDSDGLINATEAESVTPPASEQPTP